MGVRAAGVKAAGVGGAANFGSAVGEGVGGAATVGAFLALSSYGFHNFFYDRVLFLSFLSPTEKQNSANRDISSQAILQKFFVLNILFQNSHYMTIINFWLVYSNELDSMILNIT